MSCVQYSIGVENKHPLEKQGSLISVCTGGYQTTVSWTLLSTLILLCLIFSTPTHASLNRKDAVEIVKGIDADFESGNISLYINNFANELDPGVFVGDALNYSIDSQIARYLLLILVDPKGSVSVVFPDFLVREQPEKYQQFIYPPEGTGSLRQGEPVGIETVTAIASERAIAPHEFGFPDNSDIHSLGRDKTAVTEFVAKLNRLISGALSDAFVYQYFVDSDVQYDTRAIRRELKKRVQQVDILADGENDDPVAESSENRTQSGNASVPHESEALAVNDIRFETNSDALTAIGKTQLDLFGSELLNLLDDSPGITVLFEGHTDNTGPSEYNMNLSERRAQSAKQYLVREFNLPGSSITTRGMGESRPLTANIDESSRMLNRRVEIRVGRSAQ